MIRVNIGFLIITSFFFLFFLISSIFEREKRAAFVSSIFFGINTIFWLYLIKYNHLKIILYLNRILIIGFVAFTFLSLIKFFPKKEKDDLSNIELFDERDHMFSRNNLQYYPELMEKYYKDNPDKKKIDEKIHKLPELGEEGARYYDLYYSKIADASFRVLDRTTFLVEGEHSKTQKNTEPEKITEAIKFIAKYYGAVDVGITRLKPYHYYSYHGRRAENWGKKIEQKHKYAIVIIVKMDYEMIKKAPTLPVILESSRQYVEAAKIAHIIAEYIRVLGYDARSHVDGNYEVTAAPLARDAGLGEIGRLGILIHPDYGPRVRISAVTTNLELTENPKKDFSYIEKFCKFCKKCAYNCPTKSISLDDKPPQSRGFRHWSIKMESCYAFWKKIGTDCAFCIRSCPFTKKNTLLHKLVRFYISRNPINQRIALFFDNIFYGKNYKIESNNSSSFSILKKF